MKPKPKLTSNAEVEKLRAITVGTKVAVVWPKEKSFKETLKGTVVEVIDAIDPQSIRHLVDYPALKREKPIVEHLFYREYRIVR